MALVLGPNSALAHPAPAGTSLPNPQDVHVLLVDDEQLSRLFVCNLLRKCEYKVTVVESGAQAIDALQRNKPGTFQLVLSDVMMPEIDGLDILRYVRSNAGLAELPVIMMSSNEQKGAVLEAMKGGADEYLVKPVTKKELQNIWKFVWKRVSASQKLLSMSEADHQGFYGSNCSVIGDDTTATLAGILTPAVSHQHRQQQSQHTELSQSLQQLHRQQQQIVQQQDPQPSSSRTAGQQQQQQQQRAAGSSHMLLSQWLMHPKRAASHRESIWLFCEVMVLLQDMVASGSSSSWTEASEQVRPSRLVLHQSGKITAAGAAATTAASASTAEQQEDRAYRSPESAVCSGPTAAAAQGSFSLGVLLFELLNTTAAASGTSNGAATAAATAGNRWDLLAALRQRLLPPALVKRYPQEAALILSLTHPEPAARPSLQQLLDDELLSATVALVRDRHRQNLQQQQQQQDGKAADSLVFFLQTLHKKKQTEVQQVQQEVANLDAQIAEVTAALQKVQQLHSQSHGNSGEISAMLLQQQLEHVDAAGSGTLDHVETTAVQQLQQFRGSSSPALAAEQPGHTQAAAAGVDSPDDDDEMDRRELGRHKRRRLDMPVQQTQQQQQSTVEGETTHTANGAASVTGWQQVQKKFAVLESVYLKRKQQRAADPHQQVISSSAIASVAATAAEDVQCAQEVSGLRTGYLNAFADDLWAYSRYSRFAVRGTVRAAADVLGGGNAMVNAAAFDRDDEFLATAGVAKRIRIFEYSSITSNACSGGGCQAGRATAPGMGGFSQGYADAASVAGSSAGAGLGAFTAGLGGAMGVDGIVYPVLELSSRSRLLCVTWSSYVKAHLASSDVEGVVQLWDANTGSELIQFEEHAKRAWAIDFSRLEPTRLVSCSDDTTVKLWSIHQDSSVATLQLHANVCSVQFSPESPHLLAAGCSNSKIYMYDLRQASQPLACVPGHRKAVSYVRWLNGSELITASIDNTIKLWDVPGLAAAGAPGAPAAAESVAAACTATYAGHRNTRNFIGLAVLPGSPGGSSSNSGGGGGGGYIACGSETNEVYAYHTSVPVPVTSHDFSAAAAANGRRGFGSQRGSFGDLESLAELEKPTAADAFVSCVAWNKQAGTLIAANSAGHVKVLELV